MVQEVTIFEGTAERRRPAKRRFYLLLWLLIILIGLIEMRSFYLQIIQGSAWHLQAEGNRVTVTPKVAARGIIYDNRGQRLVENVASTDLMIDPALLPIAEHEAPLLDNLPRLLGVSPDEIRQDINEARQSGEMVLVARAIDHAVVIKLEGARDLLPGISLVSSSVRNYLYPYSLSHVLGYTSRVTADELDKQDDLLLTENTGKTGLEIHHNNKLRGEHGAAYVEVNAAGLPQRDVGENKSVPGADLVLTVDNELQKFIFDILAERQAKGAVVVLDPNSGAVRALVNYPSYDPNVFSQPGRQSETQQFLSDEERPLFNRAIAGTYPPGSTIKPLLAAAGLQEGIISSNSTILSTGGINVGPWSFPDWKAGGHGVTNVKKALAESVNTFFYLLAGGDATHDGLGVRRANKYLGEFSWGKKTGIDLPGESEGLLPSPEWKQQEKNEKWYIGDTYHLGIGQGDILVTPLQVAVATAAIANGGKVFEPHVIDRIAMEDGRVHDYAPVGRKIPIKLQYLNVVQQGMRQAVESGSAKRLSSLPIETAGKTGTAQYGSAEDETHAWFTSYGPWQQPNLVITVLLEEGGKGDVNAVPVAQEIWQWWVEKRIE